MYIIENQREEKILGILNKYAEKWLSNKDLKYIDLLKKENQSSNKLSWNSPENIESGLSGVAIFFIRAYQTTNQKQYFDVAQGIIDEMILYCKSNPTNNYSLFTGRCGLVYAILQIYSLNKEIRLLNEAVEIIQTAKTNYLNSTYVNDWLYEGRAGTLLTLFSLYEHINEPGILEDIYQFTEKIIDNIKLSDAGIYWEAKDELNIKPLVGFAKGTAGIRYVFNRIREILPDDLLAYLNTKLTLYESSCWIEEFNNWGDFGKDIKYEELVNEYKPTSEYKLTNDQSQGLYKPVNDFCWANGTTGLGYLRLFCKDDPISIIKILSDALAENQIEENSIYSGLAGIGSFFLEASKQFPEENYLEFALNIGDRVLMDLSDKKELNDEFFHGDIGQLYFLLSLINPEVHQVSTHQESANQESTQQGSAQQKSVQHESVLCPYAKYADKETLKSRKIKLSVNDVRQRLLDKYFPRTCQLFQKLIPEIYDEFFYRPIEPGKNELNVFISFIEGFLEDITQSPLGSPLTDLFKLEKNKYEFLRAEKRSRLQICVDEFTRHSRIIKQINHLGGRLLDATVVRSDTIEITVTQWNWSVIDESFRNRNIIHNLRKNPGRFETMQIINERNEIMENVLGNEEPFCWHWFKYKSTVRQALNEITYHYSQIDPEQMKANMERFGSKSISDFLNLVQMLHFSKVKEWLYDGVLVIAE